MGGTTTNRTPLRFCHPPTVVGGKELGWKTKISNWQVGPKDLGPCNSNQDDTCSLLAHHHLHFLFNSVAGVECCAALNGEVFLTDIKILNEQRSIIMANIERVEAVFTETEALYNRADIVSIQNQLIVPIAKEVQEIALSIAHISNSKSIANLSAIAERLEGMAEEMKGIDAAVHIIVSRVEN